MKTYIIPSIEMYEFNTCTVLASSPGSYEEPTHPSIENGNGNGNHNGWGNGNGQGNGHGNGNHNGWGNEGWNH